MRLLILLLLLATPAAADRFDIDTHLIDRCLAINGDTPMACVGRQADACIDRNGGGPNMVVAVCQRNEAVFWDDLLNRTYAEVTDLARAKQSEDVGYEPESLTDSLRDMQRAWIAYRDATCAHDVAQWRPFGSSAGPAANGCAMLETARQVFQLQGIASSYRAWEYRR